MPRRIPRSLPSPNRPTPEERLLAQQAFRYEVGILRAWDNVRRAAARAADPRTWIRRRPMGSVLTVGALAAIFMTRSKSPPSPPGIRAALARGGISLLRRAALGVIMTRIVARIRADADSIAACEMQPPVISPRPRQFRSPVRWN